MRYLILFFSLLLSACGSDSGGGSAPAVQQKSPHPGLTISDIQVSYAADGTITPTVKGLLGSVSYTLAGDALNDVVQINPQSKSLSILNAGSTQLIVTDSGSRLYKPTSSSVNITVSKAQRQPLLSNDLTYTYADGSEHQINVSGAKGKLVYQLSQDQTDQVAAVNGTGLLTISNAGQTQITVKDDGGRNYQAAETQFKVTINQAESESALYTEIANKPLVMGGKLLPVYTGTPAKNISFKLAADADSEVAQVHPETGAMNILGAGETAVVVTQRAQDNYQDIAPQTFKVQINKADNTLFNIDDVTIPYGFDEQPTLLITGVQGVLNAEIVDGESSDVISIIDPVKGQYKFEGIGKTKVRVTDSGGINYNSLEKTITVEVKRISAADPLKALDLDSDYQKDKVIKPQVIGKKGNLSFALAQNSAQGVVSINSESGEITVLKPGTAEIAVSDDGGLFYAQQNTTFTVSISKLTNHLFSVDNDQIDYIADSVYLPKAKDAQGEVSYAVASGSDSGVLSQDADTKTITLTGAGHGVITATDAGNDYYLSRTVNFHVEVAAADGTLKVSAVSAVYSPDKAVSIPISGVVGQLTFALENGQPADVVTVNAAARTVIIKNAGTTSYTVTDSGDSGTAARSVKLTVSISKAEENSALSIDNALINTVYAADKELASSVVTGRAADSVVTYYVDYAEQQVVTADRNNGNLTVKGAGRAEVQVTEKSRNYNDTKLRFTVNVSKADHPGLSLKDDFPGASFYPGVKIAAPEFNNQFGKMSFEPQYTLNAEYYEFAADGTVTVQKYPRSGVNNYITITAADDGGKNYKPDSKGYITYINPIKEGTGEQSVLTFDGTSLPILSPADVAAGDLTYFAAFDSRVELQSEGLFSKKTVVICTGPKTCKLMTIRLQTTSDCPDGSKLAYPISSKIRYNCPNMQQPTTSEVTVSFDKDDAYNQSIPAGTYHSKEPLILVHYAKPYRSGGVVEAGDIKARAWWLINVDFTVE